MVMYESMGELPYNIDAHTEEAMVERLERVWLDTVTTVRRRLAEGDAKMK
jgi:hypothetical protein